MRATAARTARRRRMAARRARSGVTVRHVGVGCINASFAVRSRARRPLTRVRDNDGGGGDATTRGGDATARAAATREVTFWG